MAARRRFSKGGAIPGSAVSPLKIVYTHDKTGFARYEGREVRNGLPGRRNYDPHRLTDAERTERRLALAEEARRRCP